MTRACGVELAALALMSGPLDHLMGGRRRWVLGLGLVGLHLVAFFLIKE